MLAPSSLMNARRVSSSSWSVMMSRLSVAGGAVRGCLPCAMAVDAPGHRQWCVLIDLRHSIDAAVTALASDALVHMNCVIEVHETRQRIYAIPLQRFASCNALSHETERTGVHPDRAVTGHACGRRWNASTCRTLDGEMAILAVNVLPGHVNAMIEGDRLRDGLIPPRGVGRAHPRHERDGNTHECARDGDERRACQGVHPSRKWRGHSDAAYIDVTGRPPLTIIDRSVRARRAQRPRASLRRARAMACASPARARS